jgi:hypothetical protein
MKISADIGQIRLDRRNAALCAGLVIAAFFAVNPFVELPFNDDWSYAWTVKQFLMTGHIIYNGWSTAAVITQTLWGALFVKVFGFSFSVLRFSTLPFAAGCGAVNYLLARRAGLTPGSAIFATITLCFSALFLPAATSFMTDVPGLFFTLFSLYALIVATDSARRISWTVAATTAAIIGGMSRQVVWIVPLALLPYVVFLRRRDAAYIVAAAICWITVAIDAALTLRWFSRQNDVVLDPPLFSSFLRALEMPRIMGIMLLAIALTTTLLIIPAAMPFCGMTLYRVWRERRGKAGIATLLVLAASTFVYFKYPFLTIEPWLVNTITPMGVLGSLELFGDRPISQPDGLRALMGAFTIFVLAVIMIHVLTWLFQPKRAFTQTREFFAAPGGQVALPAMVIFMLAYFTALAPRLAMRIIFDRYALEVMPVACIFLLRPIRCPGPLAITLLVIFSLFGLATTQDTLALARARVAAAQRLQDTGVPRTAIADGLEFNFWTQMEAEGYINREGVANSTHPHQMFVGAMPALLCEYRVEFNPRSGETDPSRFGTIDYISWLPPFHRRIYIDRYRNPWWLDPEKRKDQPIPQYWEGYDNF